MNTGTSVLTSYTDAIRNLPEEAFLGQLCFFTIRNADVDLIKAHASITQLGLDTTHLPEVLRPVDAFTKAAREVAYKFKPVHGVKSEIMVRPVGHDGDQVHRHIILERAVVEQGKKRRIAYEKIGEIVFTRGQKKDGVYSDYRVDARRTTEFVQRPLTEEESNWLDARIEDLPTRFEHLLTHMDSHAVRTFVRNSVYGMSGVCVRTSGGLYFVRQKHALDLVKLQGWVRSVGSDMNLVPLLNLSEQRELIMEAFEEEAIAEVGGLMNEVHKILADPNRTIEAKTFDAYGLRAAELKAKVEEYNTMLGERADRAIVEIDIYSQQVMALAARIRDTSVKVGGSR